MTGWRSHVELDIPRRNSVKGWHSHVELDIPPRSSLKGWPSHVELDIPRRSSLKGWRIVYGIWQSRWSWIYLEYVLKVCVSYMAVTLALDIRS